MRALWVLALWLCAGSVQAHDLRPGALSLREIAPDRFALRLTPPLDGGLSDLGLKPELPGHCRAELDALHCPGGLDGTLRIAGLASRRVKMLVAISWLDGRRFEALLPEGEDSVDIVSASSRLSTGYAKLGVLHILGGWDHLLFVLLLAWICLGRGWRRVVGAVTAFTLGHSLTLGAAALGVVVVSGPVVELLIAASIVLLAREACVETDSWTQRRPELVALLFGLLHGFGFAGALLELGLPAGHRVLALLAFNLGVELGQLVVLLAAAALLIPGRRWALIQAWPRAAGFGAGIWAMHRFSGWILTLGV